MSPKPSVLHLFAQTEWHEQAIMVGNREAFEQLRDGLIRLLNNEKDTCSEILSLMTADGEKYDMHLIQMNDFWQSDRWQSLELPYTDEYARLTSNHEKTLKPEDLHRMCLDQKGQKEEK